MSKRSIKRNYMYNLAYQLVTLVTPFITTPYISRILGADGIGISSYTNSVVTYFVLLAVLGTTDYGQRGIAYYQDEIRERSRMFWEIFCLRTFTSLFCLLLFYIFIRDSQYGFIYLLQAVNIVSVIFDITWFFQGLEEFGKTVGRNMLVRVLNLVFIFSFVKSYEDLPLYIASLTVSALIGHIVMWFSLSKYLCKVPRQEIKPFRDFRGVIQLFLPQIAIQVSAVMDKTMLGIITGSDFENGYYEQVDRIEKICMTVVSALGTVMVPRISYVIAKKQKELMEHYIYQSYRFVWLIALPMMIGLMAIADQFIPWFFGSGYEKTILLIRIFSVLLCIVGISNVTGVQYFIPAGKQRQFTTSVAMGMAVNFVMNIVLIPRFLSVGAAIATVVGELTVTVVQLVMVKRTFSIRAILSTSKTYLLGSLVMGVILVIIKPYMGNGIVGTVLLIIMGIAIYLGGLLLMRDKLIEKILISIQSKWR